MSNTKALNAYRKRRHTYKGGNPQTKKSKKENAGIKGPDTSLVIDPLNSNKFVCPKINQRNDGIPYYGWDLIFCNEEYNPGSDTIIKTQAVEKFLERHQDMRSMFFLEDLFANKAFKMDVNHLCNDDAFIQEWPDFYKNLHENPEHSLKCLKLAIHQRILNTLPKELLKSVLSNVSDQPIVRLRILNFEPIVSLWNIKLHYYGKLVSTRGTVIRVGRVKYIPFLCIFVCIKCKTRKILRQPQGNYTAPKKCEICNRSKFKAELDSPFMKCLPCQKVKIQGLSNDEQESKGRMPRTLDVRLVDDLVNTCVPGDDVLLTGIIKLFEAKKAGKKSKAVNLLPLYVEAVTLINIKHQQLISSNVADDEMSIKDYLAIKEIYNSQDIFSLLVRSLCPAIYGHEMVKAGLILGLFGGNMQASASRNNIHVLIVGDPGLGKSQMLQACARIAVKGMYVCGNSSSTSGLTVTLTKQKGIDGFALEPGALVLSDGGCCCIDEFDKMPKQHKALLECMEQQTISVAKSGIVCCLPARCSILSAANPKGGRYNKSKSILQNLNMSRPLISRFDLVFLLLDEPDKHFDNLLCKHIMSSRTGGQTSNDLIQTVPEHDARPQSSSYSTLREKLQSSSGMNIDVIPQSMLRKYIAYARQYVNPVLSEEAATTLQDHYLKLRSRKETFSRLPVCTRHLEAMIRLTEARAKLALRTEATKEDALEIIEILNYATLDSFAHAELQNFLPTRDGKITKQKVKAFISILKKNVKENGQNHFALGELKSIATQGGIAINDFRRFILKLNHEGYLLKTKSNKFEFIEDWELL